jgi:hypothetical protein
MPASVKPVPNKTIYVSEEFQRKIDRLKELLIADNVDLTDHTGVVRDAVLFRYLVDEELKRRTTASEEAGE